MSLEARFWALRLEEGVDGEGGGGKSVRWSAVPVAPKLVNVRCEGERGSGQKEPMTYAGLRFEHWSWDLSHEAEEEPSGLDWSLLAGV